MIGRDGERGSEISVLMARHDDSDDEDNILNHILLSLDQEVKQQ